MAQEDFDRSFHWKSIGDVLSEAKWQRLGELVRSPEFSNEKICALCVIFCGGNWPEGKKIDFVEAKCVVCQRDLATTQIKNWRWS